MKVDLSNPCPRPGCAGTVRVIVDDEREHSSTEDTLRRAAVALVGTTASCGTCGFRGGVTGKELLERLESKLGTLMKN